MQKLKGETFFKKWVTNKELVLSLITQEFKVKYKNSVLGFLWTFLYPLMTILIFLLVFTKLFRYDLPYYPSYLLTGLIVWNYFSETTIKNLTFFIEQAKICTKTPINKSIFLLSSIIFGTIDFLIKFIILIGMLIFLRYYFDWPTLLSINWTLFLIIPAIILEFLLITGTCFILSIIYVYLRDTVHVWYVVLQLGFFLTPIFYPDSLIPYKPMLILNPLYHLITVFRDIIIHGRIPTFYSISVTIFFSFSIFALGAYVFNKFKNRIVDKI